MKKVLILVVLALVGCKGAGNPEKVALRESISGGMDPILADHAEWAPKLVAYPVGTIDPRTGQPSDGKNKASEIKPLTPAQFDQATKLRDDLKAIISEDRARDNQPLIGQ